MVQQNYLTRESTDRLMVRTFRNDSFRSRSCITYILNRGKAITMKVAQLAHDEINKSNCSFFSKMGLYITVGDRSETIYLPNYAFTNMERILLRHECKVDFRSDDWKLCCSWARTMIKLIKRAICDAINSLSQLELDVFQCYYELYYLPLFPSVDWLNMQSHKAIYEIGDLQKTLEKLHQHMRSGVYMQGHRVIKDDRVMGGFEDIAGMEELKSQLKSDIIDVLKEPERANALGISLPNGILLYGPPGCGKTFFAEKLAEEAGCNFIQVNCSDIASTYIHGTQELIAEKFKEAEEKKPTIIFFDEIDAMIPKRNALGSEHYKNETNEFLTQLNNCGKRGIIAIGATNRPQDVDEAALRSGRLEIKVYLPAPDGVTRMMIMMKKLQNRSIRGLLVVDEFADKTEGWISSDVALVVDQAARLAFRRKQEYLDMDILNEVISKFKPTISKSQIKEYENVRDKFEGRKQERAQIGFY